MPDGAPTMKYRRKTLKDPVSGREVWQVTPDGISCAKGYMYLNHFTPDERRLTVLAAVGGRQQLCAVDLERGGMTPLADAPGLNWCSWNVHPLTGEVYYRTGERIMAVDPERGTERLVFDAAQHEELQRHTGGPIMFSGSGRWFSAQFTSDPTPRSSPPDWSHWGAVAYERCGIVRIACDGSGCEIVYRHDESMQHVMFCPADDDLLTFAVWPDYQNNAALPDEKRARAWLVDARTQTARPYLITPKGFRATHEFWSRAGDRLFYHKKAVPGWLPTSLSYLDRATGAHHDFYPDPARRLSHSAASGDGEWVVSDSVEAPGLDELVLVEVRTGRAEIICCPHQIKANAWITPPSFSPSGRFIVFACDGSGEGRVYLVPVSCSRPR